MMNREAICDLCQLESSENPLRGFANHRRNRYAINYWPGRYTDDAEHSLCVVEYLRLCWPRLKQKRDIAGELETLVALFENTWFHQTSNIKQLMYNFWFVMTGRIKGVSFGELWQMAMTEGRQGTNLFHRNAVLVTGDLFYYYYYFRSWFYSSIVSKTDDNRSDSRSPSVKGETGQCCSDARRTARLDL
jgi:hypothetical protein